jgi:ABC-type anion transport system duplicated permease subunit
VFPQLVTGLITTVGVLAMALALVLLNRVLWKRLYRLADTRFSQNR